MDQVEHKLSRLALAKAIKQEDQADSWDKSVIFKQPFIKDLKPSNSRPNENKVKNIKKNKYTCLPSDSEESDTEIVQSSSSSEEEVTIIKTQKKPLKAKHRKSVEYDSNSPSRGSLASSISLPLTEEEDENTNRKYFYSHKPPPPVIDPLPIDPIYLQRLQNYQYQLQLQQQFLLAQNLYYPPVMKQPYPTPFQQTQYYPQPQPYYYQQQYQQQHQQHQQYQHYQQHYLHSPQHHSAQHPRQHSGSVSTRSTSTKASQKTAHKKYSATDLRRRAEMLRNSNDYRTC